MERKTFLRNSLGFLGVSSLAAGCSKETTGTTDTTKETSGTTETTGTTTGSCTVTNSETEGPFPTVTPSGLVKSDIVGDRTGVGFTIILTIQDKNASCAALAGAIVDIWHCDKDGNYSQYGGTQMQSTDYTSYTFLRGRQTTGTDGKVTFTSIFPGWYQGRATHIHVHIYNASGQSLLVTQIAFPEGSDSAVVTVNSATAYGYTKGMTGYTYNANDNVFGDGVSNEMSSVSGSLSAGYTLTHTITVSA
ncbi:MAG: intradiol ring-cleavage dioxygenase [Flavihumibacter sp.]